MAAARWALDWAASLANWSFTHPVHVAAFAVVCNPGASPGDWGAAGVVLVAIFAGVHVHPVACKLVSSWVAFHFAPCGWVGFIWAVWAWAAPAFPASVDTDREDRLNHLERLPSPPPLEISCRAGGAVGSERVGIVRAVRHS